MTILITAAVNCGLIGIINFDVMSWLFDEQSVAASRIIYSIVAIASLVHQFVSGLRPEKPHHGKRRTLSPTPIRPNVTKGQPGG